MLDRQKLVEAALTGLLHKYGWMHPPKLVADKAIEYVDAVVAADAEEDADADR